MNLHQPSPERIAHAPWRRVAATALSLCLWFGLLSVTPAGAVDTEPAATERIHPDLTAARAAIKAKDFKRAVSLLERVAREEPQNADAFNLLGFSYRNLGNYRLALDHYDTALKLDPKHLGAHEYIGEAYLRMNNLAKAEEHLAILEKLCRSGCEELTELRATIVAFRRKA